eukprot:scaffold21380_cov34-Prasinocladus_malaysianus.AAC.1
MTAQRAMFDAMSPQGQRARFAQEDELEFDTFARRASSPRSPGRQFSRSPSRPLSPSPSPRHNDPAGSEAERRHWAEWGRQRPLASCQPAKPINWAPAVRRVDQICRNRPAEPAGVRR